MTAEEIKREHRIERHIESLGAKIIGSGGWWCARRCAIIEHKPGHLCVTVNVDKQVWHRNDCKKGGDIITWMAIEAGKPVAEVLKGLGGNGASKPLPAREIVAAYDYRSATGDLVFQVVRLAPKSFRQRRPDQHKPGEWIWNMDGVERVLYRLPELTRDMERGHPVFIVEGEKDAHTLAKHGFTATTGSGGAGQWQGSYSETLRGTDVIIVPDKDEPGRKHARPRIAAHPPSPHRMGRGPG